MYVIYIGFENGRPVATNEQSSKLDRAKMLADFVATDMPKCIIVTVRHHKRIGEIYYSVDGLKD